MSDRPIDNAHAEAYGREMAEDWGHFLVGWRQADTRPSGGGTAADDMAAFQVFMALIAGGAWVPNQQPDPYPPLRERVDALIAKRRAEVPPGTDPAAYEPLAELLAILGAP